MRSRFILVKKGSQICLHRDPFAIEWEDLEQDPNEQRYGVIGMVEGRLLLVGYTQGTDYIETNTGTGICASKVRVVPPSKSSRNRE